LVVYFWWLLFAGRRAKHSRNSLAVFRAA